MTREITHMKAFIARAGKHGQSRASRSASIAPTPGLVDQFFNDSTGEGDDGEVDARGPWNEGNGWVFVESPALMTSDEGAPSIVAESSPVDDVVGLQELLVDELRDLLHAEKQLTKALPKMAKAARFDQLRELFEIHLAETEAAGRTHQRML